MTNKPKQTLAPKKVKPTPKVPAGWGPAAKLSYDRKGDVVSFKATGMSNDEAVQFVVGLWLRMEPADKQRVIDELALRGAAPSESLYPTEQQSSLADNLGAKLPEAPPLTLFTPGGQRLI